MIIPNPLNPVDPLNLVNPVNPDPIPIEGLLRELQASGYIYTYHYCTDDSLN